MVNKIHIAIEGMDGVGKTTTAIELVKKLQDFQFIEKPLHYIVDTNETFNNYIKIRDYFNSKVEDDFLRAWFYGLGNILTNRINNQTNIITDRHLLSNYFWCGSKNTVPIFDLLIKHIGIPNLTVILVASEEEIHHRLRKRNENDSDISKIELHKKFVNKSKEFLEQYNMPYKIIDTTKMSLEEVVNDIICELKEQEIL